MKIYILKDSDFDALTAAIDRDPVWGTQGGSSAILNVEDREAHERAHRFFNYQIRVWIDAMKRGDRG